MEIIDHIGIFNNLIPKEYCDDFINWFELFCSDKSLNFKDGTSNVDNDKEQIFLFGNQQFNQGTIGRSDLSVFLNLVNPELSEICYNYLQQAYDEYIKLYPDLTTVPLVSTEVKMQKTSPGGGYHVWHSERMSGNQLYNSRHVTWMIYLNDMPDGEAETEFFHQKLRVKPTAGTILFWPAAYTHLHRGNTVFTQDKYILTGWFRCVYENS